MLPRPLVHLGRFGLFWMILLFGAVRAASAAPLPLTIGKAAYSAKTQTLTVTAKVKGASGMLTVLHGGGGILAGKNVGDGLQTFSIPLASAVDTPCAVELRLGDLTVSKKVAGAPAACLKAPECKIVQPAGTLDAQLNTPVGFKGQVKLKDKNAAPLRMEWDFAGGSMGEAIPGSNPTAYQRPNGAETTVQFVRGNARYRVRFTAWDKLNRYCEASVMVNVGTPPGNLPDVSDLAAEAQKSAPSPASQLTGKKDDVVVLPFADLTMPGTGDFRFTPRLEVYTPVAAITTLNAVAYRKDRLPVLLDDSQVQLKYSAASNPSDPVGLNSINSTSQNWPLNADITKAAPLLGAAIQKTDMWEVFERPASDPRQFWYNSKSWAGTNSKLDRLVPPDEGFILTDDPEDVNGAAPDDQTGRYMPGHADPFAENAKQDFTSYYPNEQKHIARAIPLTDIDDSGRVNPLPLMRVEAVDKDTGATLAAADAVVGSAKDVHCRECHTKGKIGASDKVDWHSIPLAHHSSKFYGNALCWYPEPYCSLNFQAPSFLEALDQNGQPSDSLFDQEFTASRNIGILHEFYDNTGEVGGHAGFPATDGSGYGQDGPIPCNNCHRSRISGELHSDTSYFNYNFPGFRGADQPTDSVATLSEVMHNFHEQLQLDPNDKDKILRDVIGRPKLWDPATGANPNTLFPTVDANGNALPMEQNCLRCHGGHREPLYRDRMYTAGITCYDCHGDMAAVGSAHAKPKPGTAGDSHRIGWYEQPDCGSCHIGNANQGKDGQNGFFSAGVMKRAFDANDPSATTRKPLTPRFAVQAINPIRVSSIDAEVLEGPVRYKDRPYIKSMAEPLYRKSRDTHGNVACAACHGGAHENWPNRDPKANDNVTAKQLQGHSGHILECNVCHTADSFKLEGDLDGGVYSGDAKAGILGGPHNLHPVNDPFWWKSTDGDSANADGTTYGGWHNNYAKKSGVQGEDQCAACHGNDHKGTRLSKTPVERVFDFSAFDARKLKKAGFKKKIIKVAAGAEIGCDTCHSIETSCIGSPAGSACGVASSTVPATVNHDPVISSTPSAATAVMGQPYSYQVTAGDPDGDPLSFSLGARPTNPDSMTISATGRVAYDWPQSAVAPYPQGPFTFPYTVRVSDNKGGYSTQTVTVNLSCPEGQSWVYDPNAWQGACQPDSIGAKITSTPPQAGLNAGEAFSYQVTATSDKGLPLSHALEGQPEGMTIGADNGLIAWQTDASTGGSYHFKITVSDAEGGRAFQNVALTVCKAPQTWHGDHAMCM